MLCGHLCRCVALQPLQPDNTEHLYTQLLPVCCLGLKAPPGKDLVCVRVVVVVWQQRCFWDLLLACAH